MTGIESDTWAEPFLNFVSEHHVWFTAFSAFGLGVLVHHFAHVYFGKQENGLVGLMCQFVADYENQKPALNDLAKEVYLSRSEEHESKFKARFAKEIMPQIHRQKIKVPSYKMDQRRWDEVLKFIIEA